MLLERAVPKIDIFQGLTREQITELCGWIKPLAYPPNCEIFREGQLPNGLYILTSGVVGVTKISPRGKFGLASIEAPSYFGEMGLLDGTERSAGVISKTAVEVSLLPFDVFERKLKADNLAALRIALNVGRLVSQRLRDTNKKLAVKTANVAGIRPRRP